MDWKTETLESIRRKIKIVDKYLEKEEEAIARGEKERAEWFAKKGDRLEMWVEGALDILNGIGYIIKYDKDQNIESIIGDYTLEYRVRYNIGKKNDIVNAIICGTGNEVQEVIDRIKEVSLQYPECKFAGIDIRVVCPNGDVGEWNKVFDY